MTDKYKTIHIDKERLEILLEKADPGDFFNITVYPIPHRSSLPHLVEVIERAAFDEAVALLKDAPVNSVHCIDYYNSDKEIVCKPFCSICKFTKRKDEFLRKVGG